VARTIDLAVGERMVGPIVIESDGRRVDRHAAGRIVRLVARRAGIAKRVGPHTLRHAFITAALDAGVPLRDVQEAASHADPRTTMRYDRGRQSHDRHATYIVATFIAGATRCPPDRPAFGAAGRTPRAPHVSVDSASFLRPTRACGAPLLAPGPFRFQRNGQVAGRRGPVRRRQPSTIVGWRPAA
jgi:hypothetical protein